MRKAEREVFGGEEKFAALMRCPYMTIAMNGGGAPYQVPVNFGAEQREDGRLVLYFHCAREGTKLELIKKDARVSFSAANMLRVFNKGVAPCGYTTDYESACGQGRARFAEGAERLRGLCALMAHYTGERFEEAAFDAHALALTEVVCIDVEHWTVKRLLR